VTRRARIALLAVPALFLLAFFAWPMTAIAGTGLRAGGSWQIDHALDTLTSDSTRGVLGFTLWQATLSTIASFALGSRWRGCSDGSTSLGGARCASR
jgi:thiamine transport system permease protein